MSVYETVTGLLGEILSTDPLELTPAFRLTEENGVEPIDIARLAIACEGAWGLTLYDEKIARWQRVSDVCGQIEELLEEGLAEPAERSDEERVSWFYR